MMRKNLITRVLAILLILTMCTGFAACQRINAASQPTLGTSPEADTFDKDDLLAMMDEAGKLLHRGSYTIENPSSYVQYFFRVNKKILVDCYNTKGETITINYSKDRSDRGTVLQYGIFLHLVCSRYPDAICDADYTYTFETNRPYFALLFLFPDYKQAGYKTPLEACADIYTTGKVQDNAFYIDMSSYFEIFEGHFSRGETVYKYNFEHYEKYLDNIG